MGLLGGNGMFLTWSPGCMSYLRTMLLSGICFACEWGQWTNESNSGLYIGVLWWLLRLQHLLWLWCFSEEVRGRLFVVRTEFWFVLPLPLWPDPRSDVLSMRLITGKDGVNYKKMIYFNRLNYFRNRARFGVRFSGMSSWMSIWDGFGVRLYRRMGLSR